MPLASIIRQSLLHPSHPTIPESTQQEQTLIQPAVQTNETNVCIYSKCVSLRVCVCAADFGSFSLFLCIKIIIGRIAKSVTKLLNFSGHHISTWIPTIPTIFRTVSYGDVTFSFQVLTRG